ncbi:hypothetical protein A2982_00555 [candidate division WWE3 bacterium RIFCSPLOWO2_01_FULL_39_13]|uniref:Uncharacterized protein n=1 Tax=candidate division WWE3 bacterium RIFCSPLOWO2_01_FULL_39_13 TaxID=1802624 RepID=A0A1F4V3N0_UNCKA|nr:MAG: hypothetical protein A2982_00555 [candidate division WWE3 bacterium RIFCSPLOWO2_01_FULL_39_13]
MKKFVFVAMFATILFALVLGGADAGGGISPAIVAEFAGTPQYWAPEIFNSGTMTLTLKLGDAGFDQLDSGQMTIRSRTSGVFKLRNAWVCDGKTCLWVMYLPQSTDELWIETPVQVDWTGFGAWKVRSAQDGLYKSEDATQILLRVSPPVYRDWGGQFNPTWDWALVAEPQWAAAQWLWWDQVRVEIRTTCSGHGDNHQGLFKWIGVPPWGKFGNGVYRNWLHEPLEQVDWYIDHPGGWSMIGTTYGPTCWGGITYLPLASR